MISNVIDSTLIDEKLAPLLTKKEKVRQPRQGIGSLLFFDFGAKVPRCPIETQQLAKARKRRKSPLPDRHKWRLWIYMCAWRIEKGDRVLAGAEDSRSRIEAALQYLDAKILTSVEIISPLLDTVFDFEDELKLRTFSRTSNEDDSSEHWMLFTPDGNVLVLGPGENWCYHKSSEIPSKSIKNELH